MIYLVNAQMIDRQLEVIQLLLGSKKPYKGSAMAFMSIQNPL